MVLKRSQSGGAPFKGLRRHFNWDFQSRISCRYHCGHVAKFQLIRHMFMHIFDRSFILLALVSAGVALTACKGSDVEDATATRSAATAAPDAPGAPVAPVAPGAPIAPPQPLPPTQPVETSRLPIVYSWSERSTGTAMVRGVEVMLDNYDPLPDSSLVFDGFKEANIVDRAADGTERTIYDCIGNDQVHCAALDPRVSPDNKKIAFAVVYAPSLRETRWTIHGDLPIKALSEASSAVIHIYDTETGRLTAWPRVEGVMDMHPEWISNDKVVFVSTRAKVYPVRMFHKTPAYGRHHALQRWTANADGSGAVNIGPHDDMSLHPLVLSDGNILTASWRVDEKLTVNVTPENQYWMMMTDQFGGNEVSVLGAHETMFTEDKSHYDALISLHFFGERSNGDLMTSNYYRANHMGLGLTIAFPRLPHGVEGVGSTFLPAIYRLLPWAQEEDNPTFRDSSGNLMGKGGYPSGLPGGEVLMTKGSGYCYTGLLFTDANPAFLKGPGCNTGIYVQKRIPSLHPSDLVKLVDHPDRHEFSADVRLPYSAIYGKAAPTIQTREVATSCSLQVVNTRIGKLRTGGLACSKTGACIEPGYSLADIAKLAIYEAKPNLTPQTTTVAEPLEGHDMRLLGYVTPETDGSVNVNIPCDVSYKLRGVASNGREFIRDQIKHSNRPGEARQCLGCHAGHTASDHVSDVRERFAASLAGRKPAANLTAN